MPEIVTEDYTLQITNSIPRTVTSFGTPNEVRNYAPLVKIQNKRVLRGSIGYTFTPASPCVIAGHTFVGGTGSINSNSIYVKCNNIPVLLEGVTGACNGSFLNGSGVTVPCACSLRITNAGQSVVNGR